MLGSRYRLANLEDKLEIKLGENNIKRVNNKKSLRVIRDSQLNCKIHVLVQSKKNGEIMDYQEDKEVICSPAYSG